MSEVKNFIEIDFYAMAGQDTTVLLSNPYYDGRYHCHTKAVIAKLPLEEYDKLQRKIHGELKKEIDALKAELAVLKIEHNKNSDCLDGSRGIRKKLDAQLTEARELFESLERGTDIWLPKFADVEHEGEAVALHNFRQRYLEFLEKTKENHEAKV